MTGFGTAPATAAPRAEGAGGFRLDGRRRERRLGLRALSGVLLVAVCVTGFLVAGRSESTEVLLLARDVPAGRVLAEADLRVVQVRVGAEVHVVAAGQAPAVVGRTAAVPLAAGRLLAPSDVGPVAVPPEGQAVVGLALEPGRYPPGLAAGAHVWAVIPGDGTAGTGAGVASAGPAAGGWVEAGRRVPAVVVAAEPAGPGEGAVVSAQLAEADAALVARAGAGGAVSLVLLAPGR